METMYWITRLDTISNMLQLYLMLLGAIILILFVFTCVEKFLFDEDESSHKFLKALCKATILFIIAFIFYIFIPSKSDIYEIYGIGGTMEYLQSNEKAKELPDKVINAIDYWTNDNINKLNKNK